MTVVITRESVVCSMEFAPDTIAVAGKITKLNPHKSWKRS